MDKIFYDMHDLILKNFKSTTGADERNKGYYIVHPNGNFTKESLLQKINKYEGFEGLNETQIVVFNPDTKETESLSDFVSYLNENGLGAWDSGENDD